jgi:nucleoside-diphosphate-sugar epimerase
MVFGLSIMSYDELKREDQEKWMGKNVLVTGGASFIGSHLVDRLVSLGANVTVVDDLSSGTMENLSESISGIKFIKKDLEYIGKSESNSNFHRFCI